jgi:hypothetical protein
MSFAEVHSHGTWIADYVRLRFEAARYGARFFLGFFQVAVKRHTGQVVCAAFGITRAIEIRDLFLK